MIFPFSKTYKEKLNGSVTPQNQEIILQYISKMVEEKRGDDILIENNTVSYSGSTSASRTSLFGGLSGTFSLVDMDGAFYLMYELRMGKFFIITSIMAVFFGAISQSWWGGLFAFSVLCGLNWIIYLIRHSDLVTEITYNINCVFLIKNKTPTI